MGKSNENRKEYDENFLRSSCDFCKNATGTFTNFIVKIFEENLEAYSNYRIECPLRRGFRQVTNFPMVVKGIPSFMLNVVKKEWECTLTLKAKIEKRKMMETIFILKIFGEINKNN